VQGPAPRDVLLLDAGPDFHREAGHSGSGFALVSVLEARAYTRPLLSSTLLTIFTQTTQGIPQKVLTMS